MCDILIIVSLETENCNRVLVMKGDSVDSLGSFPARFFWQIFEFISRELYAPFMCFLQFHCVSALLMAAFHCIVQPFSTGGRWLTLTWTHISAPAKSRLSIELDEHLLTEWRTVWYKTPLCISLLSSGVRCRITNQEKPSGRCSLNV